MGCCSLNPCAKGECPSKNLFQAKLSSDKANAMAFLPPDYYNGDGLSKGAIGGAAGGAVAGGLILIGALVWFLLRRKKAKKAAAAAASSQTYEPYANQGSTVAGSEAAMSPHMQKQDPFPPYSPYPSTYAGTPTHQSMGSPPAQWQQQQQHGSPEMNNGSAWGGVSTASPDPSQGHFRESMHSSYTGYGGQQQQQQPPSFASELPATAEYTTSGHTHAAEMDGGSSVPQNK
jgi:hypothetical protein